MKQNEGKSSRFENLLDHLLDYLLDYHLLMIKLFAYHIRQIMINKSQNLYISPCHKKEKKKKTRKEKVAIYNIYIIPKEKNKRKRKEKRKIALKERIRYKGYITTQ